MTKTKTSISLCGLAALAMCAFTVRPAGEQPIRIILNGKDTGKMFEGIGAASGGGAVSRLLINYPEPQRSQILDYFFKPNYGASLQHLKVEIGGDGNSTEGSEPSHMHRANDENYSRGFEWWVMKEAKKRNPNIKLHVLAWDFPAWVKEVNSQTAADYLVKYIEGVKKIHGLDIDTIGIWNETKTSYEFTRRLKRTLLAHHLKTQVSADDLVNTWEIAEAMAKDPELRDSVDVVNTHYPRFQSTPLARSFGKPVWSTEDGPWHDDWGCGGQASGPYAEVLNRNYVEGRITATILWCLVSSYYDILDVPNAGLLRAAEPWSGRFQVMSPLWIVAHTTQFAQPGWQYLDKATGLLPKGGSYVTLKQGAKYSTVIETIAATEPQELSFTVQETVSPRARSTSGALTARTGSSESRRSRPSPVGTRCKSTPTASTHSPPRPVSTRDPSHLRLRGLSPCPTATTSSTMRSATPRPTTSSNRTAPTKSSPARAAVPASACAKS